MANITVPLDRDTYDRLRKSAKANGRAVGREAAKLLERLLPAAGDARVKGETRGDPRNGRIKRGAP